MVAPRLHSEGYVLRQMPGHPLANLAGDVYVHRLVWFEAHGSIPEGHHVHHINHDRTDNRLDNLELIDAATHGAEHAYAGHAKRWGYTPGGPCHACGGSNWRYRASGRRDCRDCGARRRAERAAWPKVGGPW